MDAMKKEDGCTVDTIYALPDGSRAELIDGQLYMMAPPTTKHQRILNFLCTEINLYIRRMQGECEVFPAPFGVFLDEDDKNYIEPDISVICDKNKITEEGCNGAPDWIIEIVSKSSKSMDYMTKLFKYRRAGVREYWIVDPGRMLVIVYFFQKDTVEHYRFGEDVPVGIFAGFSIRME